MEIDARGKVVFMDEGTDPALSSLVARSNELRAETMSQPIEGRADLKKQECSLCVRQTPGMNRCELSVLHAGRSQIGRKAAWKKRSDTVLRDGRRQREFLGLAG